MVAPKALPLSCHKGTHGLWLQTVHRTLCFTRRPNCATPRYLLLFLFNFFLFAKLSFRRKNLRFYTSGLKNDEVIAPCKQSANFLHYKLFDIKKQGFTQPFLSKITPSFSNNSFCLFPPPKAKALLTCPKRFTTRWQGITPGCGLT